MIAKAGSFQKLGHTYCDSAVRGGLAEVLSWDEAAFDSNAQMRAECIGAVRAALHHSLAKIEFLNLLPWCPGRLGEAGMKAGC